MSTPKPAAFLAVGLTAAAILVADVSVAAAKSGDWDKHAPTAAAPHTTAAPKKPVANALPGGTSAKGDGVQITLAQGWKQVPLNAKQFQKFLDDAKKGNPNIRTQGLTLPASTKIGIFGAHLGDSDFTENVTVIMVDANGTDPTQLSTVAENALTKAGAQDVAPATVTLPQGPSLVVPYTLPLHVSGRSITVHGVQYYVPVDDRLAIVTFTFVNRNSALALAMVTTLKAS